MYRATLSILTVFVLACAVAAQSSQSSSSSSQTANPSTQSSTATSAGQSDTQSSQNETISGCLSGPNQEGVYVLKTSDGRQVEVGGSADLAANVGKQVSISGAWAKSGAQIGEHEKPESAERNDRADRSASSAASGEQSERGERHFKASSVQKVSDSCETSSSPK